MIGTFALEECLKLMALKSQSNARTFVIAADEMHLVDFTKTPVAIIQNNEPSEKSGQHWIFYWVDKCPYSNELEYYFFCSFGTPLYQ